MVNPGNLQLSPKCTPFWLVLIALFVLACANDSKQEMRPTGGIEKTQLEFESSAWKENEGGEYPHRAAMLDDVLYSEGIRKLKRNEVLELLGEPDRVDSLFMFYRITTKKFFGRTMTAKSLVIKFREDSTVQWIKTHG